MSGLNLGKGEGGHQLEYVDHAYAPQPLQAVPVLVPVPAYEPGMQYVIIFFSVVHSSQCTKKFGAAMQI